MWDRWGSSVIVCAGILGGLAGLGACQPPEFRRELFIIAADGANYPVMLSQTPAGPGGRKIEASSGTEASRSVTGDSKVITTRIHRSRSEVSASVDLAEQVHHADTWVQIDGVEFHARDFVAYGVFFVFSSADRRLTIQGTAYR